MSKTFKLKKFGSIIDSIDNLEIRKIYPTLFIKHIGLELPAIQRDINESHVDELVQAILTKPSILNDNRILIWNIIEGKIKIILKGHTASIASLALLNNQLLASGSADAIINIWNPYNGTLIRTINFNHN